MSSRYDRRDPGTDPDYCDGLACEEDPRDDDEPADDAGANALQRNPLLTYDGMVTASLDALHAALVEILARRRFGAADEARR